MFMQVKDISLSLLVNVACIPTRVHKLVIALLTHG